MAGNSNCAVALQNGVNLRWLKLVSTLSRDLVIRRIDTVTTTLYHVTVMLLYHVKHQLLLSKMQSFL